MIGNNKVHHAPQACGNSRDIIIRRARFLIFSPVAGCWPNDLVSAAMTTCLTRGYFIHSINFALVAHTEVCWYTCSTEHKLSHKHSRCRNDQKDEHFKKIKLTVNVSLRDYLIFASAGLNFTLKTVHSFFISYNANIKSMRLIAQSWCSDLHHWRHSVWLDNFS